MDNQDAHAWIFVINKSIADLEETIVNIDYITDGSLFDQNDIRDMPNYIFVEPCVPQLSSVAQLVEQQAVT